MVIWFCVSGYIVRQNIMVSSMEEEAVHLMVRKEKGVCVGGELETLYIFQSIPMRPTQFHHITHSSDGTQDKCEILGNSTSVCVLNFWLLLQRLYFLGAEEMLLLFSAIPGSG